MTLIRVSRLGAVGLSVAAAVALAGCTKTTYGTGTTPAMQTLKDVTGIVDVTPQKGPNIDYGPRPKVVAPPPAAAASLPAPRDTTAGADETLPANWPKDPDKEYAKFKADVAAREKAGETLPAITAIPGKRPAGDAGVINPTGRPLTKEEQDRVRKAMAEAKGIVAVDENGNPVRRYLSDPPAAYLAADPNSTVDPSTLPDKRKINKKKKGWWPF
jgi:hypothetical protein